MAVLKSRLALIILALVIVALELTASTTNRSSSEASALVEPATAPEQATAPEPAGEPEQVVIAAEREPSDVIVDSGPPDELLFVEPDAPGNTTEALPVAEETTEPPVIDNSSDFVDWAPFEQAVRNNVEAGLSEGSSASVADLAAFERAALVVCRGEATAAASASLFALDAASEVVLNRFVPSQCYLAPSGTDLQADTLAGPVTGAADWAEVTETRWLASARWIDLAAFVDAAKATCLGIGEPVAMAQSSLGQIGALVAHGECRLVWMN